MHLSLETNKESVKGKDIMFSKAIKINISILCLACVCAMPMATFSAHAASNAHMISGNTKAGYAQLSWSKGAVLPIKLRTNC